MQTAPFIPRIESQTLRRSGGTFRFDVENRLFDGDLRLVRQRANPARSLRGGLALLGGRQAELHRQFRSAHRQQDEVQIAGLVGEPERPPRIGSVAGEKLGADCDDAVDGGAALGVGGAVAGDDHPPRRDALGGSFGGIGGRVLREELLEHFGKLKLAQPAQELVLIEPIVERLRARGRSEQHDRQHGERDSPHVSPHPPGRR